MIDKNTGGPAFPSWKEDGAFAYGMTLRDYFAAKAMQAFVNGVGCKSDQQWFDEIAQGAYRVADAMLETRK